MQGTVRTNPFAREFGISLIDGATGATHVTTDGAKIVADGTAGIVELWSGKSYMYNTTDCHVMSGYPWHF